MVLKVKMGGFEVSKSPEVLETLLGSCVAIMLYDRGKKIGGMAHVMLPKTMDDNIKNPGKYVNTAIPAIIAKMVILGARTDRLTAKIVGGAAMFKKSSAIDIGKKNADAARQELKQYKIRIIGEDIGGDVSRTVKFFLKDGKAVIRYRNNEKII
ncbi:chemotaxis protein CheD [Methanothermococcus okinawensis]|uniref:Probable chemoreceptor glutamine deamidase CheD n=1 Tax=Methanothermococcus okinawensis (strain DSM 14208 / JCM 11175 / IH1) TaxID=647113 RepID=F8AK22_METOI|nr:chemotaxis protein CheD [Methanothermococcus okinawensis]AEH07383.1 CheD [Methanothermococcus okinawensis IH1]